MEGAYLLKYVSTMPFIGTADTYFIDFQLLAETIDKYKTKLASMRQAVQTNTKRGYLYYQKFESIQLIH